MRDLTALNKHWFQVIGYHMCKFATQIDHEDQMDHDSHYQVLQMNALLECLAALMLIRAPWHCMHEYIATYVTGFGKMYIVHTLDFHVHLEIFTENKCFYRFEMIENT